MTSSSRLDADWALAQLLDVLVLTGSVEADHHVLEKLAEFSAHQPLRTVQALHLMVEGDKEGWGPRMWYEQAQVVLNNALQSGDAEAVAASEDLIHLLAAKNYREYAGLLTPGGAASQE